MRAAYRETVRGKKPSCQVLSLRETLSERFNCMAGKERHRERELADDAFRLAFSATRGYLSTQTRVQHIPQRELQVALCDSPPGSP